MSEQNRPVFQSVEAVQAQFAQWNYIADRALGLEIDELRAETSGGHCRCDSEIP